MSRNVVGVMTKLAKNPSLAKLLYSDLDNPSTFPTEDLPSWKELIRPNGDKTRIFPMPFDPDGATTEDGSFIRVYYNDGEFNDNETIAESELIIDIIVSNNLWLINDGRESLVRAYDIMGRVVDLVGRRSIGTGVKLKFQGYRHHYINTEFNCIRLHAEYMSIET